MRTVVVGAGPTGLLLGAALARRGHEVVAVDRDAGPGQTPEQWTRRGVMQFHHAHAFRPQVAMALEDELPEALERWRELGAEEVEVPNPLGTRRAMVVRSRRSTYERALRLAALEQPRLTLRTGHVDALVLDRGRATGVRVDGAVVEADLVVDASGRAGRVPGARTADHPPVLDDACGLSMVDRTYRLHPGAEPGPMGTPMAWIADLDGYQYRVFLHEAGHFTVVVLRRTADTPLAALRHDAAFDAACRAVPGVADWVDPDRAAPTSHALAGGGLRNVYRSQSGTPGLVAVGDAVSSTTPTRGRGIAMACSQVLALLALLDDGADPFCVAEPFGRWCDDNVEPWVADHVAIDGGTVRRWQGEDLDLGRPLTPDLIAEAVQVDSRIGPLASPYFMMTALPETLRPAEPLARAVYEQGWRPAYASGPTRDELVEVLERAVAGV